MEWRFGDIGFIALSSFKDRAEQVNRYLNEKRGTNKNYLINVDDVRFANGEGKVKLKETIKNKDVFILCDVSNYSCTYELYGKEHCISPDEHFQDIIRTISAISGKANRVNIIMPLLYSSRQHRKTSRESLDCAIALRQLENLGISSILTIDAHDPNVQNAIPFGSFDSIFPLYPCMKSFMENEGKGLKNKDYVVIAPDSGAMNRAIKYASILASDLGMFYKRRDYTKLVNGKNPILQHDYVGADVKDKHILIVDDMISSGGSVVDICEQIVKNGAKKVSVITTFAFFTEGLERFNELHKKGILNKVYATNASYLNEEILKAPWFVEVDVCPLIGRLIDTLNKNESLSPIISSEESLHDLLKEYKFK